jgi:predicted ester cyclase
MSISQNKAAARRVTFELFAAGNLALLEELTHPDLRNEGQTAGPVDGRANLANAIARVRQAFPDLKYTLEHEVAEGDLVVHHLVARGTHRGLIGNLPATGKSAVWHEMHVMRFADGRLLEQWGIVDRLGLLQQLGSPHVAFPAT